MKAIMMEPGPISFVSLVTVNGSETGFPICYETFYRCIATIMGQKLGSFFFPLILISIFITKETENMGQTLDSVSREILWLSSSNRKATKWPSHNQKQTIPSFLILHEFCVPQGTIWWWHATVHELIPINQTKITRKVLQRRICQSVHNLIIIFSRTAY